MGQLSDIPADQWGYYLRQSLDKTGLEAAVDRQRTENIEMIRQLGGPACISPVREYKDNDKSAFSSRKPRVDYPRMIADIKAGELKVIVAWHTDRLYRRVIDLLELIPIVNDHGVIIRTVRSGDIDLSTPSGRTNAIIIARISEGEMEIKSDRQKAMHRQRAEDGRHWWSQRPFGFVKVTDKNGKAGLAEKHPVEAPLLKQAYEKVLAGVSTNSIMQEWNAAGILTSTGVKWRNQRLRQVLLNPRNAGIRTHAPYVKNEPGPATQHRPEEPKFPAIVDEETFRSVELILTDPARDLFQKNGGRARKHLLVGLAKCGKCGTTVRSGSSRRGKSQYCCRSCFGFGREMQFIDDWIIELVATRLSRSDAREVFNNPDVDLSALRNTRRILEGKKRATEDDYNHDHIDGRQLKNKLALIQQQLDEIEIEETDSLRIHKFRGVIGSPDPQTAFRSKPLDQQRAMIDDLMEITLSPGHRGRRLSDEIAREIIKVHWRIPEDGGD